MQIISVSIDLAKINKDKIKAVDKSGAPFKNGQKYYNLDVIVSDEPDKYGNNVSICEPQTKEQRTMKAKREYLGNGKTVWSSAPNVPPPHQSETPFTDEMNQINQKDDLPF